MTKSKSNKTKTYKSTRSINDILRETWEDPNAKPLPYAPKTMSKAVSKFSDDDVKRIYRDFRNNTIGGKKSKRITINKKKARKTLKKPMFKRKSAKHK